MKILNGILLISCAAAVLYYVLWSNSLATAHYRVSALRGELARLTETNSALEIQKSAMENPAAALQYAQSQQMIEAKNVSYVFESPSRLAETDANVALQK